MTGNTIQDLPALFSDDDEADARPDLSDDQLAIELGVAGFDTDALYVRLWGKWLFWNDSLWVEDETNACMTFTRKFLRAKAEQLIVRAQELLDQAEAASDKKKAEDAMKWAGRNAKRLRSAQTVAAVLKLATSNSTSAAKPEQFDAEPFLLATPSGTVDLHTGELQTSFREHYATKMTEVGPADVQSKPKL